MSTEDPAKLQNTVWWITSIAISVVCCSVLFILFASYLVELKSDIRESAMRINMIEVREDRILNDIEMLSKHNMAAQASGAVAAPAATPAATPPAETAPAASPGAATGTPAITAPSVSVPTMPTVPAKP